MWLGVWVEVCIGEKKTERERVSETCDTWTERNREQQIDRHTDRVTS